NVNAIFTNLSRRNQSLIEGQLTLITELENHEAPGCRTGDPRPGCRVRGVPAGAVVRARRLGRWRASVAASGERRAVSRRAGVDRSRTASGAYRVAAHGTSVINEGCGGAGRFLRRPSASAHRCAFRPTPGPGAGDSGGVAGETRAGVVGWAGAACGA
ncbi:hypothetical protein, partial [Streptomyces niveus]|uniref:hypothetical protein n=1 Tax=Streptomyces niveus TaxID=193462 RepID=UPI003422D316